MIFIGKCLTCDLKFIVHNILLIWLVMVGTVGHLTCPIFYLVLYEFLYHCYCCFFNLVFDYILIIRYSLNRQILYWKNGQNEIFAETKVVIEK